MKEFNVPFAFNEEHLLVSPDQAVKGKHYCCPACLEKLIFRQGEIKVQHFSHRATTICNKETIIHKTAKILICDAVRNWKKGTSSAPIVERRCPKCYRKIRQSLADEIEAAQEEYTVGEYRVDVMLLTNGLPAAAVEIKVAHAVDEKKGRTISLPYIELEGEAVIQNSLEWKPLVDKFEPFGCANCIEQEIIHRVKAQAVSNATGVPLPSDGFITGMTECWKCHKEILVFSWPGHDTYSQKPPEINPCPKTLQYRVSNTVQDSYWVNTCPFCTAIQGDFYLYSEPDGPFFGLHESDK